MTQRIRSLCAKIVSRIVAAAGVQGKEVGAKAIVHRRVELTVERESVSVLVAGIGIDGALEAARTRSGPEAPWLELSPQKRSAVKPAPSPARTIGRKPGKGRP